MQKWYYDGLRDEIVADYIIIWEEVYKFLKLYNLSKDY